MVNPKPKAVLHWSGGKDSMLCLEAVSNRLDVCCLLTTFSERYRRVSMHGVREALLDSQAQALGLPLVKVFIPLASDMQTYEEALNAKLLELATQGIETSVFGDLFLADLKAYREAQLKNLGLQAVFPLWGRDPKANVRQLLKQGYKAKIAVVNARYLSADFLGLDLSEAALNRFPEGVDWSGENGEYHTFVYEGPLLNERIELKRGEVKHQTYTPATQSDVTDCACCAVFDTSFYFLDLRSA